MDTQLNTKRILIFLAFAFGIPWTAALALYLTIGGDDLAKAGWLANWVFTLWTPALANVATRLITKEGWGHLMLRPDFRRGWRFYLAAWLLPLLAIIVGLAIFYLLFPQSFDSNFSELRKGFASSPLAAANPWTLLLIQTLSIMVVTVPILTVVSFGEEFGWRAYLLPKLVERFAGAQRANASRDDLALAGGLNAAAARKAALLIGVIWGVWHWLGNFLYDPGMPILLPLVSLVSVCSLSVLLSWVTLRSGSVWPAAVGHGAYNALIALAVYSLKGPANPLLGPAPSGLIGVIGYLALALVLLFSRSTFAGGKEAGSEKERAFTPKSRKRVSDV